MDDTQASADTAANTAAASAEDGKQQQASQEFQARIDAAKTPEELVKLQREFIETESKPKEDEGQGEKTDETGGAAEADANEGAEGGEGNESGNENAEGEQGKEETKKDEANDGAADDDDKDDDDADGETASAKKKKPYRLRGSDDVEDRAFELKKRNRDLSMRECLARAEKEINGDKAEGSNDAADGMPKTIEEAKTKLGELRAAKSKAMREELDLAKADDLDIEMEKIRDHMVVLERSKFQEATRAEQKYQQEFEASQKTAASLYDFLSDEKSAGFIRAREIDEQMKENGDPTFYSSDKPKIIAQMVAAELRIAPKSKKSPVSTAAASTKKSEAPAGSKPASVISSGGSRTANQNTQTGQQAAAIDAAQSMDDLRKLGVNVDG